MLQLAIVIVGKHVFTDAHFSEWLLHRDAEVNVLVNAFEPAVADDARLAFYILRTATRTADRENHDKITEEILHDAVEEARGQIRQKSLDSLISHQRTIDDIFHDHGPTVSSKIHE